MAPLPKGMNEDWATRWEKYNPAQAETVQSAICTDWPPDKKLVRGYRVEDLIEKITFSESIFLAIFARLPNPKESKMFEAMMVATNAGTYASSGLAAARYIYSSSENSHAAMAGGMLSFGFLHAGANEASARMIQKAVKRMKAENKTLAEMAKIIVEEHRAAGERVPGIGHHFYTRDPRRVMVFELAKRLGYFGVHCELYEAIEQEMRSWRKATQLVINLEGAAGAVINDMIPGYDTRASNLWCGIGRLPSIAAAVMEYIQRGKRDDLRIPWEYDGPPETDLPPEYSSRVR